MTKGKKDQLVISNYGNHVVINRNLVVKPEFNFIKLNIKKGSDITFLALLAKEALKAFSESESWSNVFWIVLLYTSVRMLLSK